MSTITKEWLQKAISQHESMRDEIPFGLDEEDSKTLAALRIALASLEAEIHSYTFEDDPRPLYTAPPAPIEAEPVAYMWDSDRKDVDVAGYYRPEHKIFAESSVKRYGGKVVALYAAPPAPVSVPDELTTSLASIAKEYQTTPQNALFIVVGWNAYRAAMLQSFGNSEQLNSPVIKDGWVACSERMPEVGSKVIVFRPSAEESNDPPVKTATYKGGREYYHGFDCYCEPTHWMPLPSPPVK